MFVIIRHNFLFCKINFGRKRNMKEYTKEIIYYLQCDYELFENEKSSEKIIKRWEELTEEGREKGFIPLIISSSDILEENLEFLYEDYNIEKTPEGISKHKKSIIEKAKEINAEKFLKERYEEYSDMHDDMDILGEFEDRIPTNSFSSHLDYGTNTPHEEVIIAKIPTQNPWELPVWMPMGGFNDCPLPEEQIAVFKHWYDKYGAVPAGVTYDVWEMAVENPPKTNEESEELAKEQFSFDYDIVMQGCESIRELANTLKNSTTWYFWWD